ncbi:hypothetical protein [Streptomyces bottropensis]|uniref:hypothetical protein n=1 Tax=Streptomyces bottropensis TaxID=42235 RepID=UPI00369CBED2
MREPLSHDIARTWSSRDATAAVGRGVARTPGLFSDRHLRKDRWYASPSPKRVRLSGGIVPATDPHRTRLVDVHTDGRNT